jgi:HlyD family secretion protein
MPKEKNPTRFLIPGFILVVVALGGLGLVGIGPGAPWLGSLFGSDNIAALPGPKVKRGSMVISVTQRGHLAAKDSVQIRNQLEGRTTILSLVTEGTRVKKGDLLVQLDVSSMEDRRVQQDINVGNADAQHTKAVQQLEIQVSQNDSDIARAERAQRFAIMELEKYKEGDWKQKKAQAQEDIILAKEELAQANERLEYSKKLSEEGFITRTELERDELAAKRQGITLDRANRDLEMLEKYDYPKQIELLKADIAEAGQELKRVNLQADARLVDFKATVRTSKARLDLEKEELEKYIDQIEKGTILSPTDGLVVYAREKSRWGSGDPIAEGTEVHERQEILTIPREGGMILEASLHETVIKKVEPGQKCVVTVDAIPNRSFEGRVEFVALLPDSNSFWANPNQRLFKTEISIVNPINELRTGMSCKVEIMAKHIDDTLQVPVQAVFQNAGKTVCFVDAPNGPIETAVTTGEDNDKWVQILEGLNEGDTVILSPPAGFKLAPSPQVKSNRPPETDGPPRTSGGQQDSPLSSESGNTGRPAGHANGGEGNGRAGGGPNSGKDPRSKDKEGE